MTPDQPLRFGYGTNGLHSHRLEDALALLADLGYDGVALTLDHLHLDPFAPGLAARVADVRRCLEALGLAVVVETGARYLLDPRRKHHPTLLHPAAEAERRVEYLHRAVEVAADLGAEAMSFWSGTLPPDIDGETAWTRLTHGVGRVLDLADRHDVVCAFEPEPGMLVDTLDGVLELRRRLGDPDRLRLTLDLGHVVCNEPRDLVTTIHRAGDLIANVQLDDMVPGVHEHLELGTGEVDFPAALAALQDVGYAGLAALELPRHSHAAPVVAERSLAFLRGALVPGLGAPAEAALAERCREVAADPARIRVRFPAAAREVARTPGTSPEPGADRLEDRVRVRLLEALARALADRPEELASEVHDLYRFGDADERRAVLLGLPRLGLGDRALDLVRDALRTNDPRLVAAALGPYAAAELDAATWRQGVLKCLFVGVPLRLVASLSERTDAELVRMVGDHADERRAAGRAVPTDALPILATATTTRES